MTLPPTGLTSLLYACEPTASAMADQLARHGCLASESARNRGPLVSLLEGALADARAQANRPGPSLQDLVARALVDSPFLSKKGLTLAASSQTVPHLTPPTRLESSLAITVTVLVLLALGIALFLIRPSVSSWSRYGAGVAGILVYVTLIVIWVRRQQPDLPFQATQWAVLLVPLWYTLLAGGLAGLVGGLVAGVGLRGLIFGLVGAPVHRWSMWLWRRYAVF